MSKIFSPKSRQEDERAISRRQNSFEGGMFNDVVPSQIPDNAVYELKNFRNLGYALEGRTGSKEWGNRTNEVSCAELPYYKTNISVLHVNYSPEADHAELVTSETFEASDVGNTIVLPDKSEYTIDSINANLIRYRSAITPPTPTFTINLKKHISKLNGFYFHKLLKKIVMFYGTDIYIARDLNISAWDKAICESVDIPTSEKVTFDEVNNAVIMFNSNGIYKMDLTDYPASNPIYYKINSMVPQQPLDTQIEGVIPTSTRRYLYTMSKFKRKTYDSAPLDPTLLLYNQYLSRLDNDNTLFLDSGSNLVDENLRDYASYDLGGTNMIYGFSIPNNEKHWDSYSIWATADTNVSGNNTEAYSFIADMPICQAFKVIVGAVNGVKIKRYAYIGISNLEASYKFYSVVDESTAKMWSVSSGLVNTVVDRSSYPGDGEQIGIYKFTITGDTTTDFLDDIGITTVLWYGAASGALMNVSGGIVTTVSGHTFNSSAIGERIFMQDGRQFHITGVSGTSGIIAENDIITNSIAGCWGQEGGFKKIWNGTDWVDGSRFFVDTVDEDTIKARITGYPLYQRFFQELPSSTVGATIPGWMLVAENNLLSYSQMPDGYEYLTGYYHPLYQLAQTKDNIRAFGQFTDRLVIYCANSTYFIPTNIVDSVDLTELGISISVLSTLNIADTNIGIINSKTLCDIEQNKQILITNEPAVRIFDGVSYSDSLSSKRVTNTLNKMGTSFSSTYMPYMGYIFWGNV